MMSEKLDVRMNSRKVFSVRLIALPNLVRYLGDHHRGITPLDQFYLDGLEIATRFFYDEVLVDKSKVYICEPDFNLLFNNTIDFLAPYFGGDKKQSMFRAGALWRSAGPVLASFVPRGFLAVEDGYIFMREPREGEAPPKDLMH